jgi:hypothetical protein
MRWFLIDWDDVTMSPTHAVKHLSPNSHLPAVFEDNHGAEVDIWGVGKLILDARGFVTGMSETMMHTGKQTVEGLIETADMAQLHIRQSAV